MSLNVQLCPADVPQLYTLPCPLTWSPIFSRVMNWSVCLSTSPYSKKIKIKKSTSGHILRCLSRIPTMPWVLCDQQQTSAACCSLGVRLLCRQLGGVISVPFLGHWLCDVPSHWEPLGASRIPVLPLQEKPATSPIKPPTTSYTHPPSDLEQSSCIQTSSLTLCTQSPRRCRGRDKERLFPDCRREEKGGRFLKYLTAKRSRWNEEVLLCFIFDVGKLRSYTGLPFKSQRCHSRWESTVTARMTFSRLLWLGRDGGMFTWHLLTRERSDLCRRLLFNSKDQTYLTCKIRRSGLILPSHCRATIWPRNFSVSMAH